MAYNITVVFADEDGETFSHIGSCDDTAGNAVTWEDGASTLRLPSDSSVYWIVDVIFTADGTNTHVLKLFVNNKDTGERIFNSMNLGTTVNRQIQSSPIAIAGGSSIKMIQAASP